MLPKARLTPAPQTLQRGIRVHHLVTQICKTSRSGDSLARRTPQPTALHYYPVAMTCGKSNSGGYDRSELAKDSASIDREVYIPTYQAEGKSGLGDKRLVQKGLAR
jgi:hypothetical protein